MEGFRYLEGVATLRLSEEACMGCGMCTHVCPHEVFALTEGKARILDRDLCMECGACATNCPADAISVSPGVGCATAIMKGWVSGSSPACPACGCG
jgi:NAD-dependent dihydropyrimidine dehydrogenase PreA subunit